jgi:deoxyribodipyrimidine photo-lyase
MIFENGLFIFRRDLRLIDNISLNLLNTKCKNIYTIFIFTPEQVGSSNDYKSDNAIQFMIESLFDLSQQIKKIGGRLYTFYGNNNKIIKDCINAFNIDVVSFNYDYTPYALERDYNILKICEKMKVMTVCSHDYYLHVPGSIVNGTGEPYQKFTPYYENALKKHVESPTSAKKIKITQKKIHIPNIITLEYALKKFTKPNPDILLHGGRAEGIKAILHALKTQKHYSTTHNDLEKNTTLLSAYIKFGCLSIREVYKKFHGKHDLIRQLYWRDFYINILFCFPKVLGHSLKSNYNKIHWKNNTLWFEHWKNGTTGFPIVDAGMRELNQTGYMHNRARLIVASFLVKTLLINWQHGEKYFATKLTDYDPASNNGNWQWISGGGADSQPYFRIFNPWEQAKNYDPDCEYIKKWIPELNEVPEKDILNWDSEYLNYKKINYPKPIVDYSDQKKKALEMYEKIFH